MSKPTKSSTIAALITLDRAYLADVIEGAERYGSMRLVRIGAGLRCDACGKLIADDDHCTDDEVCGGSDGPGFFLCRRSECKAGDPLTSVKARRAIYTRQRAKNDAKKAEWGWRLYDSDDPEDPYLITEATVTHAIGRMAQEAPEQLGALLAKNGDSVTASILVQLAAFDEVRYA